MQPRWIAAFLTLLVVVSSACAERDRAGLGLRLPEGDLASGKAAFLELGCVRCHSVRGEDDLPAPVDPNKMELGGELYLVRSYGQLVTAIIHPSHRISPQAPKAVRDEGVSPMESFNETMTVAQLIDLVAFLHSKYAQLGSGYSPAPL